MLKPTKLISLVLLIAFGLGCITGCENDAQNTALLGAAIGTGIGALSGGDSGGMMIGAAAGGGLGYWLGNESDKKKAEAARSHELASLRQQQSTQVVWITNSNGSRTPVKLDKSGPGYVGPQNEHYASLPTANQLKPVYGF